MFDIHRRKKKMLKIIFAYFFEKIYFTQKKTNLQKNTYILYKIYIHKQLMCNTQYTCRNLADNLTSISIGPSCSAYILLMIDCECQQKRNANYI